jgi:hypothetical protein
MYHIVLNWIALQLSGYAVVLLAREAYGGVKKYEMGGIRFSYKNRLVAIVRSHAQVGRAYPQSSRKRVEQLIV